MESFRKLLSRIEQYLAKIDDLGEDLPEKALSRIELYLAYIAGEDVELPEKPLSRVEELLAEVIASGSEIDADLLSRVEKYLAFLIDEDVELPDKPRSSVEEYLAYWAEHKTPETIITVIGNAPLTLANASAKPIVRLLQHGKCIQNGSPSVNNPVHIKCNNGEIMLVDDELPPRYKRLLGLKFNANCYFIFPGFRLRGSDTVRFSFSVDKACNVFGCYTTTSADDNYSLYASTTEGAKYLRYNGGTYASGFKSAELGTRYDVIITPTGSSGLPKNDNWTEVNFEASVDMLFGSTSIGATSSKFDGNLYGSLIVDGRLKAIPCINPSGVIGLYETYSKAFINPAVGTPESLGYDGSHYSLGVVGEEEVISLGDQHAKVVNLIGNGNKNQDTFDVITGKNTKWFALAVFDGVDEDWALNGYPKFLRINISGIGSADNNHADLLCTHGVQDRVSALDDHIDPVGSQLRWYRDMTVEDFKAWLKSEWDRGEAVIMIWRRQYPNVVWSDPKNLMAEKGTNIIRLTSEISNISLECDYYSKG